MSRCRRRWDDAQLPGSGALGLAFLPPSGRRGGKEINELGLADSQPDSCVSQSYQVGTFAPAVVIKSRLQRGVKWQGPQTSFPLPPAILNPPVDATAMDLNNLSANLTNITNSLAERPSIATLATVLLSFTGFQDWLKLFLIGGIFETSRRVAFHAWYSIVDSLWITVDFEDGDDSYGGCLHISVARVWTFDRHCRDAARVSGTDCPLLWQTG